MDSLKDDILRRSREYAQRYAIRLDRRLGFGKDGIVWETNRQSAVKVLSREELFGRELAAYQRLGERGVIDVNGHRVPQLVRFDGELWAIEMTIVHPPFVLDFASAYLDRDAPEFPDEVMDEWRAHKQEEFGDHWPRVVGILATLRRHGVHMTDVHAGNIAFAERPTDQDLRN